jgi:2-iminobutanoate/2-iminopropanoate deaminase
MRCERVNVPGLANHRAAIYAHAVVVSYAKRTVYLAGQVARDENGETVGRGDVRVQCQQVIENLRRALRAVGGDLRDMVKVTVYTTDLRYTPILDEVRLSYFREAVPTSTLVEVRKLAHPDYLVEIDGIAVVE